MQRWTQAAVALSFAMMAVAGCVEGGPRMAGTLARELRLDLTMSDLEAFGSDPSSLVDSTFVYTHGGDTVDASAVKVVIEDDGATTTKTLADFRAGEVKDGDQIRLDGVDPLADVSLRTGSDLLARREGARTEWLNVVGVPVPLAAEPGAKVGYDFAQGGEVGLSFNRLRAKEDGATVEFRDAEFTGSIEVGGHLQLGAVADGADMDLQLTGELHGEGASTAKFPVTITASGHAQAETYEHHFSGKGTFEPDLKLGFRNGRDLQHVTADGKATYEYTYSLKTPGGDAGMDDADSGTWTMPHMARSIEVVPLVAQAALLSKVWNANLAVGDSFHVDVDLDVVQFTFDSTVVSRGPKDVAGTEYDALKVHTAFELAFLDGGKPSKLLAQESDHWIEAGTYLPLLAKAEFRKTYSATDLAALFGAVRRIEPSVEFPDSLSLVLAGHTEVTLADHNEGMRVSPAMSTQGALLFPQSFEELHLDEALYGSHALDE